MLERERERVPNTALRDPGTRTSREKQPGTLPTYTTGFTAIVNSVTPAVADRRTSGGIDKAPPDRARPRQASFDEALCLIEQGAFPTDASPFGRNGPG